MKLSAFLLFLASSLAGFGQSSILVTNLAEQRTEGKKFVQELLSLKPGTNSVAKGFINIRKPKQKTVKVPVQFNINITSDDWQTIYRAHPNATTQIMLMTIRAEGRPDQIFLFEDKSTNTDSNANHIQPPLNGNETMIPFANSDFWVVDLCLDFLRWPEQRMIRKEMRSVGGAGIFCKVIESINPQPASNSYSRVVSWIKHDAPAIVHADAYDAKNNLLKVFDPKAVEKVDGEYQLREMEMRNVQTKSVTRIEFEPQAK